MKSTGIVRRIDDLGRVVIPKEIRRTLEIKEGDALELYTEGRAVCFKKYDTTINLKEAVADVMTSIQEDGIKDCFTPTEKAVIISALNLISSKIQG